MAERRDDPSKLSRVTGDEQITVDQAEKVSVYPEAAGAGPRDERSLGELFSELSQGLSTLISQEMALARAEMSEKLSRVAKDAVSLIIGGVLAFGGYLALIATVIIVLTAIGVPLWLSALIVTAVLLVAGYFLIQRGLSDLKRVNPLPERTVQSVKEDKEWAKEQLK